MIKYRMLLVLMQVLSVAGCSNHAVSKGNIAIVLLFDGINQDVEAGFRHLLYSSDIAGLSERLIEDQPEKYNHISFYVYDLSQEQQHYLSPVLTFDSVDNERDRKHRAQTFLAQLQGQVKTDAEDTIKSICRAVADLLYYCSDASTQYRVIFFSDMAQNSGGVEGLVNEPSTTGDFRFVDAHGHAKFGLTDAQTQLKTDGSWIDSCLLQWAARNPAVKNGNMEIVMTGRSGSFPNDGQCGVAVDEFWSGLFKKMGLKIMHEKKEEFANYDPFYEDRPDPTSRP